LILSAASVILSAPVEGRKRVAAWLAYVLGLATWFPIVILAVLTGRLLAEAREAQTRPLDADRLTIQLAGKRDGGDDAWTVAWADALN
jgi:hypothetical protein